MPACRDERQKWQLHAACLEHVRLVMEAQPLDQLAQHRDACPPGLLPIIDLLTGGQEFVSSLPCFNACGSGSIVALCMHDGSQNAALPVRHQDLTQSASIVTPQMHFWSRGGRFCLSCMRPIGSMSRGEASGRLGMMGTIRSPAADCIRRLW